VAAGLKPDPGKAGYKPAAGRRPAPQWIEAGIVGLLAAVLSAAALGFVLSRGYTLYFGDAEAHLNIARRIADSRTPGPDQIGTVWLPFPHLLTALLVWNDRLWQTGLAGSFPSAAAFIATCVLLYATARRLFGHVSAAAAAVAAFALNPNVLYLQSIPMTESIQFAALAGLLYSAVGFVQSGSFGFVLLAAAFSNAASMTRYEGWFLIPFVCLVFLIAGKRRRWGAAILFGALASIGPVLWLLHNLWYYSNPLEFYNGPYSAKGIYQRALDAGGSRAPGDGNWPQAVQYFWAAARLCAGWPLAVLGLAGVAAGLFKSRRWVWGLLALPPLFYVWSVHSSGANIFVPHLWPHSYYNTRYGTTLIPLLAFGIAALVASLPRTFRWYGAAASVAACVFPWILHSGSDVSIVWKESQVNSDARRAWTMQTASYLQQNLRPSDGIFTSFGDLTGIFRSAGVPLRKTLHDGNNPHWNIAVMRADRYLFEEWAVAFSGDMAATAIQRANDRCPLYDLIARVEVRGAQPIEIYRRTGSRGALADLCRRGVIPDCESRREPEKPVEDEPESER
jgi:hypothetical protein